MKDFMLHFVGLPLLMVGCFIAMCCYVVIWTWPFFVWGADSIERAGPLCILAVILWMFFWLSLTFGAFNYIGDR